MSSYATFSASILISCLKVSRPKAGWPGISNGRLEVIQLAQFEYQKVIKNAGSSYFSEMISPVLISFAAAATRVGVSKFKRPIYASSAKYHSIITPKSSYIIILTPNPSSLGRRTRYLRQLLPRRELRTIRIPRNCRRRFVHGQKILDLRQTLVCGVLWLCHCISSSCGNPGYGCWE
jgi:hypothetical protein